MLLCFLRTFWLCCLVVWHQMPAAHASVKADAIFFDGKTEVLMADISEDIAPRDFAPHLKAVALDAEPINNTVRAEQSVQKAEKYSPELAGSYSRPFHSEGLGVDVREGLLCCSTDDLRSHLRPGRGGLTVILETSVTTQESFEDVELSPVAREIGLDLRSADVPRLDNSVIGGLGSPFGLSDSGPSSVKRSLDQKYAVAAYSKPYERSHHCPEGPISLPELGYERLFFAPLLPFGIWLGWRALESADWRDRSVIHAISVVGVMLVGACIFAAGLLMLLVSQTSY